MRAVALVFLSTFILAGCVTTSPYQFHSYTLNSVDSCVVGDPVIVAKEGVRVSAGQTLPRNSDEQDFVGFTQELIYGGIQDSVITLHSREYQNNLQGQFIKPGLTLAFQYDLRRSRNIAYRQYRMRIVKADPERVTYIVTNDGTYFVPDSTRPSAPGEPILIHPSRRQVVRLRLFNGTMLDGYLTGESATHYYISATRASLTIGSPIAKSSVAALEILK